MQLMNKIRISFRCNVEKKNLNELNFPWENCFAFSVWVTTLQLQSLEFMSQFVEWEAIIQTHIIFVFTSFTYLFPIGAIA